MKILCIDTGEGKKRPTHFLVIKGDLPLQLTDEEIQPTFDTLNAGFGGFLAALKDMGFSGYSFDVLLVEAEVVTPDELEKRKRHRPPETEGLTLAPAARKLQ